MHMDPDESKSARDRRKIILHNKLHRKVTKVTVEPHMVFIYFVIYNLSLSLMT